MSTQYQGAAGSFVCYVSIGAPRVPADEHVDKLRERKREIERKLGDEAKALRAELKAVSASIAAYEKAKPKARKVGKAR